jgi:hypothetical protein
MKYGNCLVVLYRTTLSWSFIHLKIGCECITGKIAMQIKMVKEGIGCS